MPDSRLLIGAIFFNINVLRSHLVGGRDRISVTMLGHETINNVKKLCAAKTKFDEDTVSNELANFERSLALSYKNTIIGMEPAVYQMRKIVEDDGPL